MRLRNFGIIFTVLILSLGLVCAASAEVKYTNLSEKKLEIKRGYTPEAAECIECHAKKTSGIVEQWKLSKMSHAGVSCFDCHAVKKTSPMATQCEGLRGKKTYISVMVSSKTCSRCHPEEVDQFLKSGHGKLASAPVVEKAKFQKLMYHFEGGEFIGVEKGSPMNRAARATGCQMCHGTQVELGPDHKPINETWPGGVGTRYPDGNVGNCTVCHTRHQFSVEESRKPEACGACHLGPDHPNLEIYFESKHGQRFLSLGEDWNWDSAPDAWEPGDYTAPTCATCHLSGIGELSTTHNVNERLKWDLVHPKSVIRSGERGNGEKGDQLMRKVCINCHGKTHTDVQRRSLDNAVALYNTYFNKAVKMEEDLKKKGLLKKDPWKDGYLELKYYLWHHVGRRARQGAAMNAPDYAHWHGFFQLFQVYKDMEDIYNWRIKNNKIEDLSTVMSSAPY
jgi:hypothetical protein